jgi:putative nucleotidyltransferase with HDIG domain
MDSITRVLRTRQEALQRLLHRGTYVLLFCAFVLAGAVIVASDVLIPSKSKVALNEGQVALRDVLAPRSLKYESEVLSQAKRDAEVAAVRPVYDAPDPGVKSDQLQRARQILDYIENVRYDDFGTLDQKKADVAAVADLKLDGPVVEALLNIQDDSEWRAIDAQVMHLLERVMSGEVREDNIQARKDELPNLISASYSETEVKIITGIVSSLIRVNAFYNEELTQQAELEAAQNVPVEMRTYARGQMIIRAGEIATAAHIEALKQFGLLRETRRRTEHFLGGLLVMALVATALCLYIKKLHPKVYADPHLMNLLGVLFLVFLAGAQLVDADSLVQPYYFPASALAFLVATLVGPQLAIVMTVALAVLAGFVTGNSLEFAFLIVFGGTLGVLSLGRTERLNAYFAAGGVVILTDITIALLFALGADNPPSLFTVFVQIVGSVANGLLSAAVTLVGLYAISNVLNIPTSLKIVELLQPNHPLLQRLLREAPGTYQHSLQVANLAELGAQQVNANASLLRVASMYHDAGKILNPHFFVENQVDGVNPHDTLGDPCQSARIIISHVTEGDRLARRYRLPNRIRDFIMEHHGTTQVMYFHQKALSQAEKGGEAVNLSDFTYPGPRPQSRETAILMLADACESSVRARRPQSKDDIRETVDYIFEARLQGGQLDESGLTLNDLRLLRDAFLTALQGVFHPRITYPGQPGQASEALPSTAVSRLPAGKPASERVPAGKDGKASEKEVRIPLSEEAPESAPAEEATDELASQDKRVPPAPDTLAG